MRYLACHDDLLGSIYEYADKEDIDKSVNLAKIGDDVITYYYRLNVKWKRSDV